MQRWGGSAQALPPGPNEEQITRQNAGRPAAPSLRTTTETPGPNSPRPSATPPERGEGEGKTSEPTPDTVVLFGLTNSLEKLNEEYEVVADLHARAHAWTLLLSRPLRQKQRRPLWMHLSAWQAQPRNLNPNYPLTLALSLREREKPRPPQLRPSPGTFPRSQRTQRPRVLLKPPFPLPLLGGVPRSGRGGSAQVLRPGPNEEQITRQNAGPSGGSLTANDN